MAEKQPLLSLSAERSQNVHGESNPPARRRSKRTLLTAVLFVLYCYLWLPIFDKYAPLDPEPFEPHRYEGEHIDWVSCGDIDGRALECTNLTVPMDHFNATTATISSASSKTFTLSLVRLRGHNATQNLLLNPGGPGGSGANFLSRRGTQLRTIVGEGFHLLSFDPRGVNASKPEAVCYPDKEARRRLGVKQTANLRVVEDSAEAYAFAQNFVRACEDTMGEHGRYINTPQTAADMNSILDAVGQKDMVYWGFSYGTLLGQTYAGMYPERSHRVIIDGVVNQFDWYNEFTNSEDFVDTVNAMDGFFSECIKAAENCTLASVIKTNDAKELKEKVLSFIEGLYDEPLSVYVNSTVYGTLDYETLMYKAIFESLYRPPSWYGLADALAKLIEGNGTDAFLAYSDVRDEFADQDEAIHFVTQNDGKSGLKYWPEQRRDALEIILGAVNSSIFGPGLSAPYYIKQQWTIPKTHTYVPKHGVKTAHPLLILSTTYDPICPLVSARSANEAFMDSQIVEVKGYGHCSVAVPSTCAAKHIRNFLYNGTLPDGYTQCEVDGPYYVKPDTDGKMAAALAEFDDPEEMEIHMAQLELARDPGWPTWIRY